MNVESKAERSWRDARALDSVWFAPLAAAVAFALLAAGDQSLITRLLAVIVQIVVFEIVVTSHIQSRTVRRIALAVAPLSLALSVASYLMGGDTGRGIAAALGAILVAGVIATIFHRIVSAPIINLTVVVNAITVYVLAGLFYSYVFLAIDAGSSREFFAGQPDQATSVYLYFSYVTLTTVGYGDFVPGTTLARFLSVSESLIGQLYLVTILAVIVSNLGRQRRRDESPTTQADDS